MGARRYAVLMAVAVVLGATLPAHAATPPSRACRIAVIEGEANAGQAFERPIGNGLRVLLEPIASGWILRVLPAHGPRGQHDYAELATPPYHSVSPLLIGTAFSFRAQDAIAWNPRHFHFAAAPSSFAELSEIYDREMRMPQTAEADAAGARGRSLRGLETRLATLVSASPEAELAILDARLTQGTADQAQTAALVASHLHRSAYKVDQQTSGHSTPLGRIEWLRFRIRMELPKDFKPDASLPIERSGCF